MAALIYSRWQYVVLTCVRLLLSLSCCSSLDFEVGHRDQWYAGVAVVHPEVLRFARARCEAGLHVVAEGSAHADGDRQPY